MSEKSSIVIIIDFKIGNNTKSRLEIDMSFNRNQCYICFYLERAYSLQYASICVGFEFLS